MASLTYSRLYNKVSVLPVTTIKISSSSISSLPSSSNFNGQLPLICFNQNRFKASSASASAINDGDDREQQSILNGQSSPLSINSSQKSDLNIDLTFNNIKECFKSKKTSELMRALIVLKLCSYPLIVDNNQKLIKLGQTVLGRRLFRALMKATFYGHFVAGEDEKEMIPKVNHLASFGVKSIFDYSAEEDFHEEDKSSQQLNKSNDVTKTGKDQADNLKTFVVEPGFSEARKYRATARNYFYAGEAQCEKNTKIFLNCIDSVAKITNQTGFAAIKVTALCRPQFLLKLSKAITETQHLLDDSIDPIAHSKSDDKLLESLHENQRMLVKLLSWNGYIPLAKVFDYFGKGSSTKFVSPFNAEEEEMFSNMITRMEAISQHAYEIDARVLVDAEQTYLQPAINALTIEMMKKYNKKKTIIFNTYQCYLKKAFDTMRRDYKLSECFDFYFGAKLVRGAYMEQERLRAEQLGYDDPINKDFEATSEMYQKLLSFLMKEVVKKDPNSKRIAIMVASHNEDTVRFTIENMKNLGILPNHKVICFGQLYAMSDHISFTLGQSGYSIYKYVPYGPVDEVIPYLSRRAIENSSILKKADRERGLIRQEIVRRLVEGQFFYKPIGNYVPI